HAGDGVTDHWSPPCGTTVTGNTERGAGTSPCPVGGESIEVEGSGSPRLCNLESCGRTPTWPHRGRRMDSIEHLARGAAPPADYWSVRAVTEQTERVSVRDDVAEPPVRQRDAGVMVSVIRGGGLGYAGTSDVSAGGLKRAFARAAELAAATSKRGVFDYGNVPMPHPDGDYRSPNDRPITVVSLAERYEL